MKAIYIILALVTALAVSCPANDIASTNKDSFVPNAYVHYTRYPLPRDILAEARAGGTRYIDGLLDTIEAPMPDEDLWSHRFSTRASWTGMTDEIRNRIITNEIHYSARIFSAETLERLVDHDIHFTTGQVDRIVKNLDHKDTSVLQGLHDALVQTFGIWFIEGEQWINKPESERKKFKAAWRKFWDQNRDRYGKNLPLIVNDLCLEATPIKTNGALYLQVVITNYGTNDWQLTTEVPGAMKIESTFTPIKWQRVFVLIVNKKYLYPVVPMPYAISMRCHMLTPAQMKSMPDRPVHLQKVRIPAGDHYTYLLNLTEAFPKMNLRHKDIVLSYRTWETDIERPLWCGELRSNAVRFK